MKSIISHSLIALLGYGLGSVFGRNALCPLPKEPFIGMEQNPAPCSCPTCPALNTTITPEAPERTSDIIPESMKNAIAAFGRVDRETFNSVFDVGLPFDENQRGIEDVLMIYADKVGLPNNYTSLKNSPIPKMETPHHATENCMALKVVYKRPYPLQTGAPSGECLAIVHNQDDPVVHEWIRQESRDRSTWTLASTPELLKKPLRNVGRKGGYGNFLGPPKSSSTTMAQQLYSHYMQNVEVARMRLRPIARRVAINNTIVAITTNFGQFDLFLNFICSAQSNGIDTSQILLFATDEEAHQAAQQLGIESFYDSEIYRGIPKVAAGFFGDKTFQKISTAKMFCVHLLSKLGYNILFQDVDMVWYRNPAQYFASLLTQEETNFDLFFQDDGNRASLYVPYYACAGFFFVRNNPQTHFFIETFLKRFDEMHSQDQEVLNHVLADLASRYGLRTKILERTDSLFPTGYHLQSQPAYMKRIIKGDFIPYIFHMNWTNDRQEKFEKMKQMSMWFLKDDFSVDGLLTHNSTSSNRMADVCVKEPKPVCYFKDMPSTIPCNDIDKTFYPNRTSFWRVDSNGVGYLD